MNFPRPFRKDGRAQPLVSNRPCKNVALRSRAKKIFLKPMYFIKITQFLVKKKMNQYGSKLLYQIGKVMAFITLVCVPSCNKTVSPTLDNPYDKSSESYIATPTIKTRSVVQFSPDAAQSGGEFENDYGTAVIKKGVCWNTGGSPTMDDRCTDEGEGLENFVSLMTGLIPETEYLVRSYVMNSDEIAYGDEKTFSISPYYALKVITQGGGTVSLSTGEYKEGTVVEILAIPSSGWRFVEWAGDVSTNENPVNVLIDKDKTINAVFEEIPIYMLNSEVEGSGEVSPSNGQYEEWTTIELLALPLEGWRFVEWRGDAQGTDNPLSLLMDSNKTVIAIFEVIPLFTLSTLTVGNGLITPEMGEYEEGTALELLAEPSNNWRFVMWGGDLSGSVNPLSILMNNDKEITALFEWTGQGDHPWPIDTGTVLEEVFNPATGATWMDRNLGATRSATSYNDENAYGDLYQWGRAADGHEKRASGTTTTLSNDDQPGHGDFIAAVSSPNDWRITLNNNLWQGAVGMNNPCPLGYRLPTQAEWEAERQTWNSANRDGAFSSPLKLPSAGYRYYDGVSFLYVGSSGLYWSSTVDGLGAKRLYFDRNTSNVRNFFRADGRSVRCRKG